jgi:hypothetical protein
MGSHHRCVFCISAQSATGSYSYPKIFAWYRMPGIRLIALKIFVYWLLVCVCSRCINWISQLVQFLILPHFKPITSSYRAGM